MSFLSRLLSCLSGSTKSPREDASKLASRKDEDEGGEIAYAILSLLRGFRAKGVSIGGVQGEEFTSDGVRFELSCYYYTRADVYLFCNYSCHRDMASRGAYSKLRDYFGQALKIDRGEISELMNERIEAYGQMVRARADTAATLTVLSRAVHDTQNNEGRPREGFEKRVPAVSALDDFGLKKALTSFELQALPRLHEVIDRIFSGSWDVAADPHPVPNPCVEGAEEDVFHIAVEPSRHLVAAEAWKCAKADGTAEYGVRVHRGADPLSVAEAQAALYWKQILDQGKVAPEEAVNLLRTIEDATGDGFLFTEDDSSQEISEMSLLCGLSFAGLHYAIANRGVIDFPRSFLSWIEKGIAAGESFPRYRVIARSARHAEFFRRCPFPHPLFYHLARSVGHKTPAGRGGGEGVPPRHETEPDGRESP